jgi:NAD(P)-dependent dehydrogenase (short-subunit alcohol dehydrogenase family)
MPSATYCGRVEHSSYLTTWGARKIGSVLLSGVSAFLSSSILRYFAERPQPASSHIKNVPFSDHASMPRLADPRELSGAYVYLLSDGASYTTGIDTPVAGIVGAW